MNYFEELVDELEDAASDYCNAVEWGTGIRGADKRLRTVKKALLDEYQKLQSQVNALQKRVDEWVFVTIQENAK